MTKIAIKLKNKLCLYFWQLIYTTLDWCLKQRILKVGEKIKKTRHNIEKSQKWSYRMTSKYVNVISTSRQENIFK